MQNADNKYCCFNAVDIFYVLCVFQKNFRVENSCIGNNYSHDLSFIPFPLACSIFANIFENALEACKNLPSNEHPYIKISIHRHHQNALFHVSNSCNPSYIKEKNGVFISNKAGGNHEMGLSIVRSAVVTLFGNCEISAEDNRFIVNIQLPSS